MNALSRLRRYSICAMLLLTLSMTAAAQPAKVSVWSPDPILASQLGPEERSASFQWRAPCGYHRMFVIRSAVNLEDPILFSPPRSDKTNARLVIDSGDTLETATLAPNDLLTFMQHFAQSGNPSFIVLSTEHGVVNGLPAIRERYQFPLPTGAIEHGFIYILKGKGGCFTAQGSDAEPYSKTTLPLLETSVLTTYEAQKSPNSLDVAPSPTKS